MIITTKKGKKVKQTGVAPIKGSKSIYDYLLKTDKVETCSIINYADKQGNVSSTRFEVMIKTKNGGKVSPRIIGYSYPTGNVYSMELLCDNLGGYAVDDAWCGVKTAGRKKAKNGSDLYAMDLENVLKFLRAL